MDSRNKTAGDDLPNGTMSGRFIMQGFQAAQELVRQTFEEHQLTHAVLIVLMATAIAVSLKKAIGNALLSPLRGIPGPWLAGATSWYEFYYDVIQGGTYAKQFAQMHRRYNSPLVRISPNHIHVADPQFYHEMFAMGAAGYRFRKPKYFYNSMGISSAIGSHYDNNVHQRHRSAMSVGFSIRSLQAFNLVILRHARDAMDIIASGVDGQPVILSHPARAYTIDIVAEIAFGRPLGVLRERGPTPPTILAMDDFPSQFAFIKHFPSWSLVLAVLPTWLSEWMNPGYHYIRKKGYQAVTDLVETRAREGRSNEEYQDGTGFIFECLLCPSPKKEYTPPGIEGLVDEACSFLVGGSDTTGFTLQAVVFLVLSHEEVKQRLRQELEEAATFIRHEFDMLQVSKLPWLSSVIRETMRLYPPTPGPLPREVPPEGIRIGNHFLPGGTVVSSTLLSLHRHPDIFPQPDRFMPERWLGEGAAQLTQWWNPFGRGPRSCIGRHVAWHELVTFTALLFLRFDLELFETDESNLIWKEKLFTHFRAPIQVKVVADRWA